MEGTIAALATPVGIGGIAVIRLSGAEAISIADRLFAARSGGKIAEMQGYTCAYGKVYDGDQPLDEVVATLFRAPASYTGEDVVEISLHGGRYLGDRLLQLCYEQGARPAERGEFTKRAFVNGKLTLTAAEAVKDLIAAEGKQAAQAAMAAHEGALFQFVEQIIQSLSTTAALLCAWIDYPEEDLEPVDPVQLVEQLRNHEAQLSGLLRDFDRWKLVREGIDTVIAGKPNVGKSTLMNLLTGYKRSIVTAVAGTTRDIVTETIDLDGILLHLSDTAGIRESSDPVEQAGVAMAVDRLGSAQLVLAVFDAEAGFDETDGKILQYCKNKAVLAIINKTDCNCPFDDSPITEKFDHVVRISALQNQGIDQLKEEIIRMFQLYQLDGRAAALANSRQKLAAQAASRELRQAIEAMEQGFSYDAVSCCIEQALQQLLELNGKRVTDTVVDQVFSQFCVGK